MWSLLPYLKSKHHWGASLCWGVAASDLMSDVFKSVPLSWVKKCTGGCIYLARKSCLGTEESMWLKNCYLWHFLGMWPQKSWVVKVPLLTGEKCCATTWGSPMYRWAKRGFTQPREVIPGQLIVSWFFAHTFTWLYLQHFFTARMLPSLMWLSQSITLQGSFIHAANSTNMRCSSL